MIDSELGFVAVRGQRGRGGHDAGVTDEDIETGFAGLEGLGCGVDGGKRGEIAGEESNGGGGSARVAYRGDQGFRGGAIAARDVDFGGVMLGQSESGAGSEAGGTWDG